MEKIKYGNLNARQKEIYNFQKASAIFADFGFTTIKLSDDWMGADFIAISFNGNQYLKVQLKTRLTFEKNYQGKDIFICFNDQVTGIWYLYPHDKCLERFINNIGSTEAWTLHGKYSYPNLSNFAKEQLGEYLLK